MFDNTGMTTAVAGISDIDLAVEVWRGMGDYLRNLDITQSELDAFIIPLVKEYDEYYNDSDYGAIMQLTGKTPEDIKRVRDEILSTTVEDLKGYADFVDELVRQDRVFAVLGKEAADSAEFDFAYYADAETLMIYPRITKKPVSYISGRTENTFCPDEPLTRAEAAEMTASLFADRRAPETEAAYSDADESAWYYDAAASLSEKGIMSGYDDGSFRPEESISRAEFACILSKFIYGGETGFEGEYIDLNKEDWFYEGMAKMIANGLIAGYENNMICPDKPVTRAEAVVIMNRLLGKNYSDGMTNPFSDTVGHWAFEEITAAVN